MKTEMVETREVCVTVSKEPQPETIRVMLRVMKRPGPETITVPIRVERRQPGLTEIRVRPLVGRTD